MSALALLGPISTADAASASIEADPFTVRDYEVKLTATPASVRGSRAFVTLVFVRKQGGWTQTHTWGFEGLRLTNSRTLGSGRVTGKLGAFGTIDLKFRATRRARRGRPAGRLCLGSETRRVGRLSGRLAFTPGDTYFGTVSASRIRARQVESHRVRCLGLTPPLPSGLTLIAEGTSGLYLDWSKQQNREAAASVSLHHAGGERFLEGPGTLTANADLTSATVAGGGPWLTGSLTYGAKAPPGNDQGTEGTASGDLTAHFDGLAPIRIAPTSASLTDYGR